MYGLVNKAICDLVCEKFGEDTWDDIVDEAGVDVDVFASMESYDDKVTYQLVGAASKVLDTPAADLLEAFGHYWTLYVGREGYGDLMMANGNGLADVLRSLDEMHTRVAVTFPELNPPSFRLEETEGGMTLHYMTHRKGLGLMVVGLLKGLFEITGEFAEIEYLPGEDGDRVHDQFYIKPQ